MIFIVIFCITVLGNLLSAIVKNKILNNVFYIGLVICLICIASSQTMNSDFNAYYRYYINTNYLDIEIGYIALVNFCRDALMLNYKSFRIVIFIISFVLSAIAFYKLSENYNLILLLYSFLFMAVNVTQIRYFLAESIMFIAFLFWINDKKTSYLIMTIIASLFHKSVLFFIILYPLGFSRFSTFFYKHRKKMIIIVIVLTLVFEFVSTAIPSIVSIVHYFDDSTSALAQFQDYAGINYIKYLPLPILQFMLFMMKDNNNNKVIKKYEMFFYASLLIYPFFTITRHLSRISRTITTILFTPYLMKKSVKSKMKVLYVMTFIIYMGYAFYSISAYTNCLDWLLNYTCLALY